MYLAVLKNAEYRSILLPGPSGSMMVGCRPFSKIVIDYTYITYRE